MAGLVPAIHAFMSVESQKDVDARDKRGHHDEKRMRTVVLTGFGPFPGAPFNPTGPLVERLARARRPALAEVTVVTHVFPTSYAAVDRELPALLARHRPDALLMFGLAPRAKMLRVETRARNTLTLLPDAGGHAACGTKIAHRGPSARTLPVPAPHLLAALRMARVPAGLSRDAGRYLCNYLIWRAAEAAAKPGGPRLAAFIHVPPVRRGPRRRGRKSRLSLDDLARAGTRALFMLAAAARR
jgi:pyroglutamyl-peptidase